MIDTDKYEGHTQGHWAITTRKGTWVVYTQDNGDVATMNDYEDARLIADAPLLLEAYKQLREWYSVMEYRLEMAEDVLGRSDWYYIYSKLIQEEEE
jgi:hypothetical protein